MTAPKRASKALAAQRRSAALVGLAPVMPTLAKADVHDGRKIGHAVHIGIAIVAKQTLRPEPSEIIEVAAQAVRELTIPYRQAALARLVSSISLYFRLYSPDFDWQFVGAEVLIAPRVRVDLLWWCDEVGFIADEVKSGDVRSAEALDALRSQTEAHRSACLARFGDGFAGVREALLVNPEIACSIAPDGTRTPIHPRQEG